MGYLRPGILSSLIASARSHRLATFMPTHPSCLRTEQRSTANASRDDACLSRSGHVGSYLVSRATISPTELASLETRPSLVSLFHPVPAPQTGAPTVHVRCTTAVILTAWSWKRRRCPCPWRHVAQFRGCLVDVTSRPLLLLFCQYEFLLFSGRRELEKDSEIHKTHFWQKFRSRHRQIC